MDLSIVLVNYRSRDDVLECLASLAGDVVAYSHETVVVDNDGADGLREALAARFPAARHVASGGNVGFARGVNRGLAESTGAAVLIVNPDCQAQPGMVPALMRWLTAHPDCGIAAPRILNPDGTLEYSARSYPGPLTFLFNRYSLLTRLFPGNPWSRRYLLTDWDHASPRDVDWVSGACMLARRAAIERVGGMDEAFFMFNEDVDWCRRMNDAGFKVTYVPDATVVHHIGASRRRVANKVIYERHRGMLHYFRKHHPTNPVLSWVAGAVILARAGLMMAANALRPRG